MTARDTTNAYRLARTRRFSRRSENSVGRVTHKREAPTDTVQLVTTFCADPLSPVVQEMLELRLHPPNV